MAARDVIESAPSGLLDVNGWDLKKAIYLLVKGNAGILEWMRSPIVYQRDQDFVSAFLTLADDVAHRGLIGRTYLHVGQAQWDRFVSADDAVPLKRLFYALRRR